MAYLGRYYRTYALDFWGFGESGKKRDTYAVQDFVTLVDQFMEQLGIGQAPLVGHSMGGTVSLSVAIQYPERVSKVVVIGSPIVGSSLSFLLKLFGQRPIASLVYHNLWTLKLGFRILAPFYTTRPSLAGNDEPRSLPHHPGILLDEHRLAAEDRSATRAATRSTVPAMGMYGDRDIVVHPQQWQPMQEGIPHARIERFPKAGHFIMLDEPPVFMETLHDFLDKPDLEPSPHQLDTQTGVQAQKNVESAAHV